MDSPHIEGQEHRENLAKGRRLFLEDDACRAALAIASEASAVNAQGNALGQPFPDPYRERGDGCREIHRTDNQCFQASEEKGRSGGNCLLAKLYQMRRERCLCIGLRKKLGIALPQMVLGASRLAILPKNGSDLDNAILTGVRRCSVWHAELK